MHHIITHPIPSHHTNWRDMKRFTDGPMGETLAEEKQALFDDMRHLRAQYQRYGVTDASTNLGGVGGLLLRERERLFQIGLGM